MYLKLDGVVLRETEYKDADKLLTVLTRDRGRLTLKARGAKGVRSPIKASSQLLAYSEFTVFEQRGYYTITEAAPKELFMDLRSDLELLSLASYFAQVAEVVSQEDSPNPKLLSLLLNSMYALSRLHRPQLLVKAVFELRTACLAGYAPDLSGCTVCGCGTPDRFNVSHGILQCDSCRSEDLDGLRLPVSSGTLAALRYIAGCSDKQLFSFQLGSGTAEELSGLTETYLTTQLERGFYTLDFYKSLRIS